ncbi:MAG: elongation factor 4 [Candidatus Hydrogenedentota bacterium]|nr:MAG: elongation factor 4 [Candidatus Hydrogenedentota bacterium]
MDFSKIPAENIRNFSIIAHIDHGKSTLADRLLELAAVTDDRTRKDQILDSMDIERERGITIKSNSASFLYHYQDKPYLFNLIDTPGHVDFSYEVARSLAACEGVLLLIDATQGIQAQTIANFYLALEADLMILPVINKVDLPSADPDRVREQIEETLGLNPEDAVEVSGKTGFGVDNLMQKIVEYIPPPKNTEKDRLRALAYDAYFDSYRGVIMKVRIFDGVMHKDDKIRFMSSDTEYTVGELGISQIQLVPQERLKSGQVGYVVTGIKNVSDVHLGDTLTHSVNSAEKPLFKYREAKPMVFSGLFPVNGEDYALLKDAMEKLALNDPALTFEPENSEALGFGYRVGYLGLLHMEIVQERLEREFGLSLISTAPSVVYRVHLRNKDEVMEVDNPAKLPDAGLIDFIEEPYVKVTIITPSEFMGNILELLNEKRGINNSMDYLDTKTVQIVYELPLSEMIYEFYDRLKSASKGYASLDYEFSEYKKSDLVKVDILVHGNKVDALSMIVHRTQAEARGREVIKNLRGLIRKHQFQIALQAAIGGKIIARENISALRKNVTAKCYGGDITRKRKLLEKQKAGKKRMKMIGNVEIPQEAFLAVLKKNDGSSSRK